MASCQNSAPRSEFSNVGADPKYEEEVSGCTASVGLISSTKIFVVSVANKTLVPCTD